MAVTKQNKKEKEMQSLSESILSDLESNKSLEEIIPCCKKLARLRGDDYAIKWFILELNGYEVGSIPQGIQSSDLSQIALSAGRGTQNYNLMTKANEPHYWTESIPSIQASISSSQTALDNLKPPMNYTPAITKASEVGWMAGATFVQESYRDVLNAVKIQQNQLINTINSRKSLLSKIRNAVYDYVLSINIQLRFDSVTESLFQQTKKMIDKKLQEINPDILKKFVAAYNRVDSSNEEELSQAMSSCRNALKAYANSVFPPQKEKYVTKDKVELVVTDDKVKNRLLAYIDSNSKGKRRKLLVARTSDLETRIHAIGGFLAKGTHNEITKTDVNMCIIETYLLIGSLLDI